MTPDPRVCGQWAPCSTAVAEWPRRTLWLLPGPSPAGLLPAFLRTPDPYNLLPLAAPTHAPEDESLTPPSGTCVPASWPGPGCSSGGMRLVAYTASGLLTSLVSAVRRSFLRFAGAGFCFVCGAESRRQMLFQGPASQMPHVPCL